MVGDYKYSVVYMARPQMEGGYLGPGYSVKMMEIHIRIIVSG